MYPSLDDAFHYYTSTPDGQSELKKKIEDQTPLLRAETRMDKTDKIGFRSIETMSIANYSGSSQQGEWRLVFHYTDPSGAERVGQLYLGTVSPPSKVTWIDGKKGTQDEVGLDEDKTSVYQGELKWLLATFPYDRMMLAGENFSLPEDSWKVKDFLAAVAEHPVAKER